MQRDDRVVAVSIEQELARTHAAIASLIPEDAWLNGLRNAWRAESKLLQLQIASTVGFQVPATVLTNKWESVQQLAQDRDVVYKTFRGQLETSTENRIVFTRRLDPHTLSTLRQAQPWPGLYQEYVPATREWRITVVGDKAFSAAIHARGDAKVDWRKHQFSNDVRFTNEDLPPAVEAACIELVATLGLRYGAIDLIERSDGEFLFLEVNPNGQYGWLETQLGLPISEAIAQQLLSIASR